MKNSTHDLSIPINSDTLFTRADMTRIYNTRHVWQADRHCNAEYELHIILQGVCQVDVRDNHFTLRQQQAILISPGQYHLPNSLPGPFERFSLSFTLSEGPLLRTMQEQVPVCRVLTLTPEVIGLCRSLLREHAQKTAFWQNMQPALLSQLIISTLRLLHVDQPAQPIRSVQRESVRTDLIDDYFERNFARDASLADLARLLHLSRRQAARVLESSYGMGFQQKLISCRMDHAAWLLRTTTQPSGQIAAAVGYASETAFYQAFRLHFQMTPRQYRKHSTNLLSHS